MENLRSIWPNWDDEKPFAALLAGLLFILFLGGVTEVFNDLKENQFIGRAPVTPNTITIVGEGKVTAVPNVATVDLGLLTSSKQVAEAQAENTRKMNELKRRLRELGVDAKDMKTTNYSAYPRYDYENGRQTLSAFDVQESLNVKVRDPDKLATILQVAGEVGSNQIGGLSFTVDEPETLKQEARRKTITNAREKAEALAQSIGVRLGRIVSFNEATLDGQPPYPVYAREGLGAGGGGAPDIQRGSVEIVSNVTLSYELR